MTNRRAFLAVLAIGVLALLQLRHAPVLAVPAGTLHYPDLQTIVPLNSFAINRPTSTTRELRYTHHSTNFGDGPLEVRPQYDPTTDTARAFQRIYTHDASGAWTVAAE